MIFGNRFKEDSRNEKTGCFAAWTRILQDLFILLSILFFHKQSLLIRKSRNHQFIFSTKSIKGLQSFIKALIVSFLLKKVSFVIFLLNILLKNQTSHLQKENAREPKLCLKPLLEMIHHDNGIYCTIELNHIGTNMTILRGNLQARQWWTGIERWVFPQSKPFLKWALLFSLSSGLQVVSKPA